MFSEVIELMRDRENTKEQLLMTETDIVEARYFLVDTLFAFNCDAPNDYSRFLGKSVTSWTMFFTMKFYTSFAMKWKIGHN